MERKEICHQVLNGLLVIRSLCLQAKRGKMGVDEALGKIQERCKEIEAALNRAQSAGRIEQSAEVKPLNGEPGTVNRPAGDSDG